MRASLVAVSSCVQVVIADNGTGFDTCRGGGTNARPRNLGDQRQGSGQSPSHRNARVVELE
jgi:hypothetical protein